LFCITSIESILLISQQSDRSGYDSGLIVLFLFFITSLNDILQYICGTLFGKNHLAPYLSPNKTIEGAVGGIFLTGIIVAATLPFIVTIAWPTAIIVGMFISILGILGDLSFSYYKRQAKIKDIGTSMPGHGGLLDRIDSLTLTAPGFGICLSMIS
jgi:phosphatidate cytidylyltransferase